VHVQSQIDDQTIIRHISYCGVFVALIGYGLYCIASWMS